MRCGQYRVVSGLWRILRFLGSTTHLSTLLTATCDPGWITAGFEVGAEMKHVNPSFIKILWKAKGYTAFVDALHALPVPLARLWVGRVTLYTPRGNELSFLVSSVKLP